MTNSWKESMTELGCPDDLQAYFSYIFIYFMPFCDHCGVSIESCNSCDFVEENDRYFLFAANEMKKHGWVVPKPNALACKLCAEKLGLEHDEQAI